MKTQHFRAIWLLLSVPFLAAADGGGCSGDQPIGSNDPPGGGIHNPTGDCTAPGNGAIECYSVPDAGDQWMLDCDHPRDRIYWHVYARSDAGGVSAYMLPRPDGTGIHYAICDGPDAGLATLFEGYGLCEPTLGPGGVEAINSMDLADALAISHALHERLVFTPYEIDGSWDIAPFALPADLKAACPATDNPSIISKCDHVLDAVCGPTDIGVVFGLTEAEAGELAQALNQLYGIDG